MAAVGEAIEVVTTAVMEVAATLGAVMEAVMVTKAGVAAGEDLHLPGLQLPRSQPQAGVFKIVEGYRSTLKEWGSLYS